jgi:hypothetical protein
MGDISAPNLGRRIMNANVNVNETARHPATGQIMFRAGHPYLFITTKSFTLGQTGLQIQANTEILFDGTKAMIDGAEYVLPFLRGAVKQNWLVLAEEYVLNDPSYGVRTSANIQVRHATQGGNPMAPQPRAAIATTESDEREVGSATRHAAQTRTANAAFVRGQTGVNVVQPGTAVKTQRGMMVVEEQDGIEVPGRTLKTASGEKAKNTRVDLTSNDAADALRQAANVEIQPGRGMTRDEMLARMTPEAAAEYLATKSAYSGQHVDPNSLPAITPTHRKTVARVETQKQTESHGMRTTMSVGGGTETFDGSDGEIVGSVRNETQTFEVEGLKFTTLNGPKNGVQPARQPAAPAPSAKVASGPSSEVRLRLAKAICPDFPENYDFSASTKKKIARITADFEDRHDVLRAIFAAEDDEMKNLLVAEFPAVFGG